MENSTWNRCQENSDQILSSGLFLLKSQSMIVHHQISSETAGVYLISLNGRDHYTGESINLKKRVKQQFKFSISTFYKNFQKKYSDSPIQISDFNLQSLSVAIGRKELEEFTIVNLKTKLNKFHADKQSICSKLSDSKPWLEIQNNFNSILRSGMEVALKQDRCSWYEAKPPKNAGVYLVRNSKSDLIYIGESSGLNERYVKHSNKTYFSALRRHIGSVLLNRKLIKKYNKNNRGFSDVDDIAVSQFLRQCTYSYLPVSFARVELEELMINHVQPVLNRKSKSRG